MSTTTLVPAGTVSRSPDSSSLLARTLRHVPAAASSSESFTTQYVSLHDLVDPAMSMIFFFQLDFEDEPPDSDEAESERSVDSDSEEDHFEDALEKLTL